MSEPLPCPFCGQKLTKRGEVVGYIHISVPGTKCLMDQAFIRGREVAMWNRRFPTIPHNGTINATEKANG